MNNLKSLKQLLQRGNGSATRRYFIEEARECWMSKCLLIVTCFFILYTVIGCSRKGRGGNPIFPPIPLKVSLSADTTSGYSPLTVTFTIEFEDTESSNVVENPDKYPGTYILDYGDSSEKSTGNIVSKTAKQVLHVYNCLIEACDYNAVLFVTNSSGGRSGYSSLSIGVKNGNI